ncbi:MAG TPA: hypothetical protein VD929_02235 [Caulobacteraceae bacterium]|nr:hypothetical protein [Caulobacteraceae bacterium]
MADGRSELEEAAARLDRAVAALEARVRGLKSRAARPEGDLFDAAPDPGGPSPRERALEEAAAEASAALGRAADQVRLILNGEG